MDRGRLADIRVGVQDECAGGGSGYLIGRRLVLTARHVVIEEATGTWWPRLEVWLRHPAGAVRRVSAEPMWASAMLDAALIELCEDAAGQPPVRWGCFLGDVPERYTGLAFPGFVDFESGRGVEQLGGTIPPLAVGSNGGYVLDQDAAPRDAVAAGSAWGGASGAAVFCRGLLVGVVAQDERRFPGDRLYGVRADALLTDEDFRDLVVRDTGMPPVVEAVELRDSRGRRDLFEPPRGKDRPGTPGSLLAPGVEAVEFHGRRDMLGTLAGWLREDATFSVGLVTGEGGQGKTRLARRFVDDSRAAGWIAGFLTRPAGAGSGRGAGTAEALASYVAVVRAASKPVLIVADYAEANAEDLAVLAGLFEDPPVARVRLLLLARSSGAWWHRFTETWPELARAWTLAPLNASGEARRAAYSAAVEAFGEWLASLPQSPVPGADLEKWRSLALRLKNEPPPLDDARLGNALSLQVAALTDLLALGTGEPRPPLGEPDELALIRHELGYLRSLAGRRNLMVRGVLSARLDDDTRLMEAHQALDRVVAGLILTGSGDEGHCRALAGLAFAGSASAADDDGRGSGGTDLRDEIVDWLAALYPPDHSEVVVGRLQPDRLAELLLGEILCKQTGLLQRVGALVEDLVVAHRALFTLVRTAGHPRYADVGDQTRELIVARPDPFAIVAPPLAAVLPDAPQLRDGLFELGLTDPDTYESTAHAIVDGLPPRFGERGTGQRHLQPLPHRSSPGPHSLTPRPLPPRPRPLSVQPGCLAHGAGATRGSAALRTGGGADPAGTGRGRPRPPQRGARRLPDQPGNHALDLGTPGGGAAPRPGGGAHLPEAGRDPPRPPPPRTGRLPGQPGVLSGRAGTFGGGAVH
ncbi:serine protease [Spirillospora sp. NBC_00431]